MSFKRARGQPGRQSARRPPSSCPRARPGHRFRGAAWFMAPSILLTFIFVYGFIAFSGLISFSNWKRPTRQDLSIRDPFGATYIEMFGEQRWQAGMRNVVVFTVLFLLLTVVGGLVMAILVHNVTVGKGLFRSVFLLPYALSFIVTGVAFRWIFNPNDGINVWLRETRCRAREPTQVDHQHHGRVLHLQTRRHRVPAGRPRASRSP